MSRLEKADAITVSEQTNAVVNACVDELGEEIVTAAVVSAAHHLQGAAESLGGLEEVPFEKRREVDIAADRCVISVHTAVEGMINAFTQAVVPLNAEQQARLEAARLVDSALFPNGRDFVRGRWSEQYGGTEMLLARSQDEDVMTALALLGLDHQLALLASLHEEYGFRMGYTTVLADEEDGPLAAWHDALEVFLATVITNHRRDGALRSRLTESYEEIARSTRRKKTPKKEELQAQETAPAAQPAG